MADTPKAAGVSDDAVRKATGRGWKEWFDLLDAADASAMKHADIARHLHEEHDCPPWWSQQVTVGYEQARGLRQKHQKPGGFEVGVSKTFPMPLAELEAAWTDEGRTAWLDDARFSVHKHTPGKSLRGRWSEEGEPDQLVGVYFWDKGADKSQVQVQHAKLPDAEAVERMRAWWKDALGRLETALGPS